MANMIARLGVLLGLDSAEFNKGLENAGRKLDEFTQQAQRAATVGAAAFAALTAKAMMYADEVSDVAQANDIAIDSIIKLQDALANSGGKAENAGKLLASFTAYVDKAAEGSFEAQKVFSKTGVTLQDLAKLSSEELFAKTIQGIAGIEDPITRNAKAMEMFGKAAKGVDFVGVAEGMQVMSKLTEEQAKGVQELANLYDKLAQSSRNFLLMFAKEIGPLLSQTYDHFAKIKESTEGTGNFLKTVFETIAVLAANVAFVFQQIALDIQTIFKQFGALASGDLTEFNRLHKEAVERAKKDREELEAFERRIMFRTTAGAGRGLVTPALVGGDQSGLRREVKPGIDKEAEAEQKRLSQMYAKAHQARMQEIEDVNKAQEAYANLIDRIVESQEAQNSYLNFEKQVIELERQKVDMSEADFALAKEILQIRFQQQQAIERLQKASLTPKDREEAIAKENALYEKRVQLAKELSDVEVGRRFGTMEEGFGRSFNQWMRNLPTELERGSMMFDSLMSNMESAIERFVRTGKLSFSDFARSVIQDLLLIQIRAQASQLFSMFLGSIGFGSPSTTGPKARAMGGPVESGSSYIVGERGPEMFVPRTPGAIIPNNQLSGAMKTQNVTNYNIQAIDVKSFEERIFGSANAVWAASAYAQKRLPLGAGRM